MRAHETREHHVSAWQPIASAPKDGTWLLLIGSRWELPCVGQWSYLSNCWQDFDNAIADPTHWMPLPAPPEPTP